MTPKAFRSTDEAPCPVVDAILPKKLFRLRPARTSDIEAILAIQAVCFTNQTLVERERNFASTRDIDAVIRTSVEMWVERRSPTVVCEVNGVVVGYAAARPHSTDGALHAHSKVLLLDQIAILPEFRARGLGRALLDRVIMTVKKFGCVMLLAHISQHVEDFYAMAGWTILPAETGVAWIENECAEDRIYMPEGITGLVASAVRVDFPQSDIGFGTMAILNIDAESLCASWAVDASWDKSLFGAMGAHLSLVNEDARVLKGIPESAFRAYYLPCIEAIYGASALSDGERAWTLANEVSEM